MRKRSFQEKKKLLYKFSSIGVIIFVLWGSLMFYDCAARPTVADQETGMIYPKNCHGTIVYITFAESILWYALPLTGFALFFILVVINRSLKRDDGWVFPIDSDDDPI